jgi:hypothetical protein
MQYRKSIVIYISSILDFKVRKRRGKIGLAWVEVAGKIEETQWLEFKVL